MLDDDTTNPSTGDDTPQKVNQVSVTEEQEEIDFYIHQILDHNYKYDLSPLSKQIEPSIISSTENDCIHVTKLNLPILVQIDDGAQTTTCHDKSILHNYQPYSPSCQRSTILGGDKIIHKPGGFGYIYTVTSDNELIKLKSEYTPSFPITVISPGKYEEQLGNPKQKVVM